LDEHSLEDDIKHCRATVLLTMALSQRRTM